MENTVFAVFVNDEGKILSLKRSPDKEWYPNKWDVISGKIHGGESPEECLRREVLEEIGISDFEIVRKIHTH